MTTYLVLVNGLDDRLSKPVTNLQEAKRQFKAIVDRHSDDERCLVELFSYPDPDDECKLFEVLKTKEIINDSRKKSAK